MLTQPITTQDIQDAFDNFHTVRALVWRNDYTIAVNVQGVKLYNNDYFVTPDGVSFYKAVTIWIEK